MTATITLELDGKQYTVTDYQDGENAAWALEYRWTEHNFSCDCNRSILCGLPKMPCGERFKLVKIELKESPTPYRTGQV